MLYKACGFLYINLLKADAKFLKDELVFLVRDALSFVHRRPSVVSTLSFFSSKAAFIPCSRGSERLAPNPARQPFS